MATDDIAELTKRLADSKVEESFQLSFKGKGLKLDKCDDANEIVDAIENCKTLTALVLEGNTLGTEAAEAIGTALKKHSEFKRALWSDMFTGRLKAEIPQALQHLGAAMIAARARLVELDLSDNALGPNGVVGIIDLLKSQTCYTLKELRLNNNGLGPVGGKMLASCLMDCYNSSKDVGLPLALQVFISGRGRLENEGSIALAKVFKLMGSLQEVAMPQNGINHEGITALAEAFELNPNLRILNLNDNTFTVTGAKAMAKVLPKIQDLEVINFGDCLMGTDGAKAIASALCDRHTSLRELILSGNEIAKSGINAVVEALENKDKLEVLDLNYNQFGEQGLKLLKVSLETIGRLDALQHLSDDEGSGSEDEDYDENHEEEDVQDDDEEGVELDDPELQITGKAISPKLTLNVHDFLSFPSPTKLQCIGNNLTASLRQELGSDISDIEKTVHSLVRISTVIAENDTKSKETVCDCADNILGEIIKNGIDNSVLIANAYLVYMGILKGEEKSYRPPSDLTGPLILLNHIVGQGYFPHPAKKIIAAFIDKPSPILNKSFEVRNKLLQTIYSS